MTAPLHRSPNSPIFDAYPIRIMIGLAGSLGLLLALVHLPLQNSSDRVGWTSSSSPERIAVSEVRTETSAEETENAKTANGSPVLSDTRRPTRPDQPESSEASPNPNPKPDSGRSSTQSSQSSSKVSSVTMLEATDRMPTIKGGMGRLYPKINYPKEARQRGIEGTLTLEFTVQTDGTVSNVEVVQSLHPLLDSAAVKGLHSVKFTPATHNGTPVPIRMRLPVQFRLLSVPRFSKTSDAIPKDKS